MPHLQTERGTSPVGQLSEDLLTMILNILYDSFDDDPSNLDASRSRNQVYLAASHVSRFWRFVALENPLWWSKINVCLPWKIEALDAYLKRSKDCQLEVKFSACHHFRDSASSLNIHTVGPSPTDYLQLLDFLVPHLHRCRVLQLGALFHRNNPLPFSSFQPFLDADMPYLEEFVVEETLTHYMQGLFERGFGPMFRCAPMLRTLSLSVDVSPFCQPPPSLTTLHLSRGSNPHQTPFKDLKAVLESCRSLITLAVYDNLLCSPALCVAEALNLENLYILGDMRCVSDLLLFLRTPKLQTLAIVPMTPIDLRIYIIAGPVLHNTHFPSLKSLTLAPAEQDDFIGVEMASIAFPFVERLVLINADISACVDLLASRDESKVAFPNLKVLGLADSDGTGAIKTIRDMARFRAKQNRPLHRVYLDADAFEWYNHVLGFMDEGDEAEQAPSNFMEGDLWEPQRRELLFAQQKHKFI